MEGISLSEFVGLLAGVAAIMLALSIISRQFLLLYLDTSNGRGASIITKPFGWILYYEKPVKPGQLRLVRIANAVLNVMKWLFWSGLALVILRIIFAY